MLTMRRSKQTNKITKNKHTRRRMAFNSNDFFLAHRMGQFDPLLLWGPMSKLKLLWMDFLSIEVHFNAAHVKQTNVKYVQFAFLFFSSLLLSYLVFQQPVPGALPSSGMLLMLLFFLPSCATQNCMATKWQPARMRKLCGCANNVCVRAHSIHTTLVIEEIN